MPQDFIDREIRRLERVKRRKGKSPLPLEETIREKIPEGLQDKLIKAFAAAFRFLFEKGTPYITKTYDREQIEAELQVYSHLFERDKSRKSWKRLSSATEKRRLVDTAITTAEGVIPGLLGIGIPDIPVFTAFILRGVYELGLSYGFDCNRMEERYFALKLIEGAMTGGDEAVIRSIRRSGRLIDLGVATDFDVEAQLYKTSGTLAEALLVAKFVQGLPVVGAVGGGYNLITYRRITAFAKRQYQLRYLYKARKGEKT